METLTLVASGEDINVADTTITVTIIDDDLELRAAPSEITVVEGGSRTFTVSLSHRTSEEIMVDIVSSSSDSKLELSSQQLMFTQNTMRQTVTVRALEDEDNETGEIERLTLTARGGEYDGMTATVTVTITDDDLELVVEPTAMCNEGGPEGRFDVSLSHTPSSQVTVNIASESNSNLSLSGTELTFDAANSPQSVTVTAGEDDNSLDETETLTLTADENYYRKQAIVTVTILDAQDPELVIDPPAISVPEGESNTFSVALSEEPLATVTVGIAKASGASSELTLELTSLTFTIDNWSNPQNVTVRRA